MKCNGNNSTMREYGLRHMQEIETKQQCDANAVGIRERRRNRLTTLGRRAAERLKDASGINAREDGHESPLENPQFMSTAYAQNASREKRRPRPPCLPPCPPPCPKPPCPKRFCQKGIRAHVSTAIAQLRNTCARTPLFCCPRAPF